MLSKTVRSILVAIAALILGSPKSVHCECIRQHFTSDVRAVVVKELPRAESAEDAINDVFSKVAQIAPSLRDTWDRTLVGFGRWLQQTAHNVCRRIRKWRKRWPVPITDEIECGRAPVMAVSPQDADEAAFVLANLALTDPVAARILKGRYLLEESREDIAAALNLHPDTVSRKARKAATFLRQKFPKKVVGRLPRSVL